MSAAEPRVFLVGAGPGNPGLLTLRAAELLARADLVLYDQLVPRRLLDFAKAGAELICVRDLPGHHPDKYPHIHTLLIERARAGQTVVRLKGGDPLIFGRGGEEAEALRDAGIGYEIVPGITAALAAGAYLDIPLTHRNYSSATALVTGHELPHKPGNPLDWRALAAFPGTLCIYMGVAKLPVIVSELLKHGKPADTPACIVERASTGEQRTIHAPLADLEEARRHAGLEAPGLIVIGEAVSKRPEHSWWESRPLFGRRVLVTRPAHQSADMVRKLELLGAVVYRLPAVEIQEPSDWAPVDQVIQELGGTSMGSTGVLAGAGQGNPMGGTGVLAGAGNLAGAEMGGTGVLAGASPGVVPASSPVRPSPFQHIREELVTRRNLPHIQKPGATYHLIFRTQDNLVLSPEARDSVLSACRYWDGRKMRLHAVAVMPDHVHMLATPNTVQTEVTADSVSLSELLHSIKGYSAKQVNKLMHRTGAVWMAETYDRFMRSDEDFEEKYEYIANNPIKDGLVTGRGEYPHLYLAHEDGTVRTGEDAGATHGRTGEDAGATQVGATHATQTRTGEDAGATHAKSTSTRAGEDAGATNTGASMVGPSPWNWIVFTSANGVHAFFKRIAALGRDLRILGGVKLAAIGPKTAAALREYHLNADIVPAKFNSEGLAEALKTAAGKQRVLLARANRGRDLLREELSKVADVHQIIVYNQVDSVTPDADVLDHLRRGEVHYVTLTSSKIAENLLTFFDETMRGRVERGEIELVAISPETGNAVRALGFTVAAEATEYTADGLIEAVLKQAASRPRH